MRLKKNLKWKELDIIISSNSTKYKKIHRELGLCVECKNVARLKADGTYSRLCQNHYEKRLEAKKKARRAANII